MSLTKKEWKAVERLIAKLQGRPAEFHEMETVLKSFYKAGHDNCFSITISSKSCAISTTMSRLLDDYPGVFRLVIKDSHTAMLLIRTVQQHKYKVVQNDLQNLNASVQMHGSNFHLTLQ